MQYKERYIRQESETTGQYALLHNSLELRRAPDREDVSEEC